MTPTRSRKILPSLSNLLLAVLAAVLLVLSFPDLEIWVLAWIALVPLLWAIEREGSVRRSFLLGWLFGTTYFFGTCWWLTYAPIHYASIPWPIAYALILIACLGAGVFPAIFAAVLAQLLKRYGRTAWLAAPFVWVFAEFARYWLTGNNWNALGYSQAFASVPLRNLSSLGGIWLASFAVCYVSVAVFAALRARDVKLTAAGAAVSAVCLIAAYLSANPFTPCTSGKCETAKVIAVQPNVPMSGLDLVKWEKLRQRQIELAQSEIDKLKPQGSTTPTTVVLPESPMNFMYTEDPDFQRFTREFTTGNNVSLVFNSAEPDMGSGGKYFNSAVMIGADGRKVAEYDKIYLLPFGEAVPVPFDSIMPGFVGNFAYGRNYGLLPVGDAKAGVMICFESHFGALGREYDNSGADVLLEMTNDGYLGPTPVLRQHLANAVFRAVETDRPLLRVTNVGITAYITADGQVVDPAPSYAEAVRVWNVEKSDGSRTLYVRFGDWFAWLCTLVTLAMLALSFKRRNELTEARA